MNIKEVEFIFENCEWTVFPKECIKSLKIVPTLEELNNEDKVHSFECELNLFPNARFGYSFNEHTTPIHRLCEYSDLVYIIIHFEDNTELKLYMPWDYNGGDCNNINQSSKMIDWDSCILKVEENSKAYNLSEIFNFEVGDFEKIKFIGSDGKIYILDQDEDGKYLYDTFMCEKLLKMTFKRA